MSSMYQRSDFHSQAILSQWTILLSRILPGAGEAVLDGSNLDIPTIVAVAR